MKNSEDSEKKQKVTFVWRQVSRKEQSPKFISVCGAIIRRKWTCFQKHENLQGVKKKKLKSNKKEGIDK